MGIFCQINLFRPSDAVYNPRQDVSGVIKYSVDEPKEVLRIITSLKGIGKIILTDNSGPRESLYKSTESYVDIDTIIQNERIVIPVGSYEIKFNYTLPPNIPSSMRYKKKFKDYKVRCFIVYYIRIKFEKTSLFSFNKHFRKAIIVMAPVEAKLLREPVMHEEKKKLFQLSPFSKRDSLIIITATILNSALPIKGKIVVHYAVANKSHVRIEVIKTRLVEAHTFKAKGHRKVTDETAVLGTKAGQVVCLNRGDTRNMFLEIILPSHVFSLENAVIASRYYYVRIIATLPIPHKNAVLDIPIQIGVFEPNAQCSLPSVSFGDPRPSVSYGDPPPLVNFDDPPQFVNLNGPPPTVNFDDPPPSVNFDDPPPSYWEVMGEINDNEDASDDEPLIA